MRNKIGIMIEYKRGVNLVERINAAKELGLESFQLSIWDPTLYTDEEAEVIRNAIQETGFVMSALWAGWTGPCEWNFNYGPTTIGLVPPAYRFQRVQELLKASEFAEKINVTDIITHVGFLPENPDSPDFAGTVGALRYLCKKMQKKGQNFLFETGQETPVTMLRTIEAIGTDNLGINFDTANLILYGKANSVDALEVFGKYVRNTHIKDGLYPTDGMKLGHETAVGEGKGNIPAVVAKLKELGYEGHFTIEREITGEQQITDIAIAKALLEKTFDELGMN